ncbi:hypothetical protein [Hyalangium sp.]|uniref:hypothetical protein n=1 Tax=Hyalangium sp. TaxID=2028555 RepID=UPI002D4B4878|nr:hypothetical protein [Hyalangium sp.]HYH99420.1 hypothetical protein [Hyalangium sp.]
MKLLENPFHILGASIRDDRRRILELAEERSLSLDPALCAQARADLTHPRNRLAAEVAWVPGLDPGNAGQAMEFLRHDPLAVLSAQGLPALAKANLLAAALPALEGTWVGGGLSTEILELATLVETCDAEKVRTIINLERAISGFPEVRETSAVEEALAERRRHYRATLKSALDALPPRELVTVVTRVVTEATGRGTRNAPALIDDLVNTYEVEAQHFLDAEVRNVELLAEAVRRGLAQQRSLPVIKRLLSRLEEVVRNWDKVAQPIQLSAMSRGLDHEPSHRVANLVRDLSLELYNEHEMLEASQDLTALLQDTFGEVPRVAELASSDAQALHDLAQKREASRQEWAREISYEALVGIQHPKQLLKISASGIDWQGKHWPLETITRIRWGGVTDESKGPPQFTITLGNGDASADITTLNSDTFSTLTNKVWRAVGRRLLIELLTELGKGTRFQFGDASVDDSGINFARHQYPGDSSRARGAWSQIHIESSNGTLLIRHKEDFAAYTALPYLLVDNVQVLETAIRDLLATKYPVLMSDMLRGA